MKLGQCIKAGALGLSLFCLSQANAQVFENERFKFGIKGGYSLSSIAPTSKKNVWNDGQDHRNGFYAGVVAEYSLTREKGASIQLEVLYSQQGVKYKEDVPFIGQASYTLEYDYITVPVLAKIYVIDRVALYGGPTIAFNVNDKSVLKIDHVESSFNNDINKVDVLATAGVEVTIFDGIYVEGRYNHGLKSVFKDAGNNFNNSNIQVGVGFKF
ncbi:PorT family protein [Flavobacterium agricola]|uniref:PorT family protein n=1 Tax=Flavobacterium agricola TaxID=2870839 RepID=A0ABY6LWS2_9FLAO|nr:porin family protein [Flavobacterium agricola]UYW00407.1 PorT family protein [Flavobacterium agricola]